MSGDLVATLSIDTSGFTEPLNQAAQIAEQSNERVVRVINEQRGSWLQLASSSVPAIAQITSAVAGLAATVVAAQSQTQVLTAISSAWNTAGAAAYRFGGVALKGVAVAFPPVATAAAVAGGALLAYKIVTNDTVQSMAKSAATAVTSSAAFSELGSSLGNLGSKLTQPFSDGASAVAAYANSFNPIPAIMSALDQQVAAWANSAAKAVDSATVAVEYYQASFVAAALAITSSSGMTATAYYNEGVQLKELAAESARVISIQEGQRSAYQAMRQVQEQATLAAARGEEIASISTLKTVEAINEKTLALQQLHQELVSTGQLDEGQAKHMAGLFGALAKQKIGVESGKIKEETGGDFGGGGSFGAPEAVQSMIDAAKNSLNQLTLGETEAAVAAAILKGANEDEAEALRALLDEKEALAFANEMEAESAKLVAQAMKEEEAAIERTGNQINDLMDELDALTDKSTKGENAMQKALRNGATQEQAETIRDLVDEIEAKKDENKKPGKAAKQQDNTFAALGSQDAAKVVLSGLGGTTKLETIAQKQEKHLEKIAKNSDKKPTANNDNGEDIPA